MACRRIIDVPRMALCRFPLPLCSTSMISTHLCSGRNVQDCSNPRQFATKKVDIYEKPGLFFKLRAKLGLTLFPPAIYRAAALFLYEKIDNVSTEEFFKEFGLEDTFYSWFLVMELHFWIIMCAISKYKREGKYAKETLANSMWEDVKRRMTLMTRLAHSDQRKVFIELHDSMTYGLALYDHGIQTNDMKLAEAVWQRLYRGREVDPVNLEKLVYYIRKQVLHFDQITKEDLILRGKGTWIPIKECKFN